MAFIPGSEIAILRPSKKRSPLRPGWLAKNTAAIATDPEMPYQIVAERVTHALSWLTQNVQALANKNFAAGQVAPKRTPNIRDWLRKNVQGLVDKAYTGLKLSQNGGQMFAQDWPSAQIVFKRRAGPRN